MYEKKQLDALWERIKDERNVFAGEYVGLKPVAFTIELEQFKRKHREKLSKSSESIVLTDLETAVEKLAPADIKFHHLSCAADAGLDDNTALCIHYQMPNESRNCALAIPGINYVPTQKTLENVQLVFGTAENPRSF